MTDIEGQTTRHANEAGSEKQTGLDLVLDDANILIGLQQKISPVTKYRGGIFGAAIDKQFTLVASVNRNTVANRELLESLYQPLEVVVYLGFRDP